MHTPLTRAKAYAKNRQNRVEAVKQLGGKCVQCSSTENLRFDHKDYATVTKYSKDMWSWSKVRRDKELALCQLLCKSCQGKRFKATYTTPLVHGTLNGYNNKGCRCGFCTDAQRERHADYLFRRQYGLKYKP